MPIQPRLPKRRLNSGEWLCAKSLLGPQLPAARSSARNARTSRRSVSHSGGRVSGSKRNTSPTAFLAPSLVLCDRNDGPASGQMSARGGTSRAASRSADARERRRSPMTCRSLHAAGFAAMLATTAALFPHHAAAQAAGDDANLTQMAHGVVIVAELSGLPPGPHGMHIHAVAKCEPPAFTSAGGHFNPTGHKHGYNAEAGPHLGDLPNVIVATDGKATVDVWVADLSLGDSHVASGTSTPDKPAAGGAQTASSNAHNVFDQGGATLIIHAKVDDYASDPAGNSGDRIACGVIER